MIVSTKKLQIPNDIREIALRLQAKGFQAYAVGGAVRDSLLRRKISEWDLCTSALPKDVTRLFKKVIPTGLKHGTVTVLTPKKTPVEVTTLRLEGAYTDGRRPDEVQFTENLAEDLARRDFTINAMAWDPSTQKLYDPFDGKKDLAKKIIRTVGRAVDRFNEDGLRPIRAVRFATQLNFALDAEVKAAIPETLEVTKKVAIERVREELMKVLAAPKPSIGLRLFKETGLLAWILPELLEGVGLEQNEFHAYDVFEHSLRACDAGEGDARLRMALLLHDIAKPRTRSFAKGAYHFYGHDRVGANMTDEILKRLRFSNEDREHIVNLVTYHMFYYKEDWSDSAVRRLLRNVGENNIEDLLALRIADEKASGVNAPDYDRLKAFRARLAKIKAEDTALNVRQLAIDGNDIMKALKIKPGKQVGDILEALLEKVLDDPALNDKKTLLRLAKEVTPKT